MTPRLLLLEECARSCGSRVFADGLNVRGVGGKVGALAEAVEFGHILLGVVQGHFDDVLKIHWAGTFLPKHRVGNPGGNTELFVQVERGLYRLK